MASCSGTAALRTVETAGVLSVEILGARNLPPAILGSLLKWTPSYSNPYVVLSLANEEFVSTVQMKKLNPTWKELGVLNVPLPSDQEMMQTAGFGGGETGKMIDSGSTSSSATAAYMAKKLGSSGRSNSGSSFPSTGSYAKRGKRPEFHPCSPELYVQVFHRMDEPKAAVAAAASSSEEQEHMEDKLIGAVVVPLLPCLLSSTSSHRGWYALVDEDHHDAGQIQLAMNFDVGGMEPIKGDIVRLTGFGGMQYYSKLLPPNPRLEVIETFQDQVLAQCKSCEGWPLSFEFHRNLLRVVRRPSVLRDARTQLQGQMIKVTQLPLVTSAKRIWRALPLEQQQQLAKSYQFTAFSSAMMYNTVATSLQETLDNGFYAGMQTCMLQSNEMYGKVKNEFVRVYWPAGADEIDCGPMKGRGRITVAFTPANRLSYESDSGEELVDDEEEEEEEGEENEGEEQGSNEEPEVECPDQLICPITGCPMVDPVVAADGHSYEREAILHWFTTSDISPMTGMHMETKQVFPNFTLRKLSEEFQIAQRMNKATQRR